MAAIITYPSAIEYWLREKGIPYHFRFDPMSSGVNNKAVQRATSSRADIIQSVNELKFTEPVHVLAVESVQRNATDSIVFHRMPKKLPANSFLKVSEGIYICSPEYCFLQAAKYLSFPQLVLLANDLCAIYMKDDETEYQQRRRDPITTVKKIQSFLNQSNNIQGVTRAKRAIRYALDRSNSPMESRLAVLARLPFSRGGYALPEPKLNLRLRLQKKAADYLGRDYCTCDIVWEEQKVILEYDSSLSHLNKEQHIQDKGRATALTMSGYKVLSATSEQVKNFGNVEILFINLRQELNMRTHQNRLDQYYELRRKVVHQLLFADRWNSPKGETQNMYKFPEMWNNNNTDW